ncbi:LPS assembly lipoprotein LptE [Teredinibacter turnerae]|uniref:LPS-assembly lipoprotein LptE n=1 Tax=Teredinibacter turnerae TaxID=2426 RepID=UPI00037D842F|nr:LPS assembly lipoprotein LptE [Teredinibacter turnerae]
MNSSPFPKTSALFACALCLVLSACGWQLRGVNPHSTSTALPGELHVLAREPNSAMARTLRRILTSKNIHPTSAAALTLELDDVRLEKRPLSVSETGVTAQYQLVLTVRYHYSQGAASAQPLRSAVQEVSSWRTYDFDPKIIVAKNQEEQALREEMREELAWRMLDAVPELSRAEVTAD